MSFQFRRRPDSANSKNQQDPYFYPNNSGQAYQDYPAQPSTGSMPYPGHGQVPGQAQGYDPRFQHPVMPNSFAPGGYEQQYQQPEPYFAQQPQYDNQHSSTYGGNFQYNETPLYNQQHQPQNFAQVPSGFESTPYMHPFQSNQMPRQAMGAGAPSGVYQNQGAPGSEKFKPFTFWKDANSSQQTGFEEPELESSSPVKLLVSVVGVAILAGLSWFAYKWVRSPELDNPPLIHAEDGAYKVRPDHKGGVNIPYQDKLIYERISDAEQPEERLLPPPEDPMLDNIQPPMTPDGMAIQQPSQQNMQQPQQRQYDAQYSQQPVPQQYAPPGQPYPQHQQPMHPQHYGAQIPIKPQVTYDVAQQTAETVSSSQIEKEKPATTVKGTFFVQLATVKSEEAALREWKRLKNKHGLQNQKSQVKEFETTEGDTVYRLLMGPFDDKVKALKHAVKIDGSKIVQMTE